MGRIDLYIVGQDRFTDLGNIKPVSVKRLGLMDRANGKSRPVLGGAGVSRRQSQSDEG